MGDAGYTLLGHFDVAINRLVGSSLPADLDFGGQLTPQEDLNIRVANCCAAVSRLGLEQSYWREPEFAARFRRLMDLLHPRLQANRLLSTADREVFFLKDIGEVELERSAREFVQLYRCEPGTAKALKQLMRNQAKLASR
jgi:hypothetical protein